MRTVYLGRECFHVGVGKFDDDNSLLIDGSLQCQLAPSLLRLVVLTEHSHLSLHQVSVSSLAPTLAGLLQLIHYFLFPLPSFANE